MYINNPYAQAGWATAHQAPSNTSQPPSIFGALPFSPPSTAPALLAFQFTAFAPTILNSTVVGPRGRGYFRVATAEVRGAERTVLEDAGGRGVALIEWGAVPPAVEVRGVMERRTTQAWMCLARDRRSRTMEARGRYYTWAPRGEFICLYSDFEPELMARISRGQGTVTLEVSTRAVQFGLLEVIVVATLLLQCGRNID